MTSSTAAQSATTTAPSAPLAYLETSLNKIFLSVGDFLDFNSQTSSLGLDAFSRKPQDTARRTLESSLQIFQSACDALEIQINRAKQVLRREIEALANPPREEVEEKPEEVPENPEQEEEEVEEQKEEEVKQVGEVEEMDDEEGLFSSEFDNLMDPNGFNTDFGDNMEWMNDV